LLSSASLGLAVGVTNHPSPSALISWMAFPGTSNTLLSATSSKSSNWTVVTNFNYTGPFPARVSVIDPIQTNGLRFYRVRAMTR